MNRPKRRLQSYIILQMAFRFVVKRKIINEFGFYFQGEGMEWNFAIRPA